MTDYTKSEKQQQIEATDRALAEFLARGGKIQTVPTGKSGIPEGGFASAWGRPRKRSVMPDEVAVVPEVDTVAELDVELAEDAVTEITGDEVVFTFDDDDDDKPEQE
jgi:hypothetical protein